MLSRLLKSAAMPDFDSEETLTGKLWPYAAAVCIGLVFTLPFLGLPMSEDMGYYGWLSRLVNAGYVPHNDWPVGQNSLSIYLNAAVMRLFGETPLVFRLIYVFFTAVFCSVFYALCRAALASRGKALLAVAAACLFVYQPQLQAGLGRNHLIPVMALFCGGILCALSAEGKRGMFFAGLLCGLGFSFNESVVPFCLVPPLIYLFNRGTRGFAGALLSSALGSLLSLAVPLWLFWHYGNFQAYLNDFFYLGVGFRVSGAYSNRIGNYIFISWDLWRIYAALLAAWLPSFLTAERPSGEKLIARIVVPVTAVVVLLVNATREYHLMMLTPFLCISAVESLSLAWGKLRDAAPLLSGGWKDRIKQMAASEVEIGGGRTLKHAFYAVAVPAVLFAVVNLYALAYDYSSALRGSMLYWDYFVAGHRLPHDQNEIRSAEVLNLLPHDRVAAFSQYPTLFLLDRVSVGRPMVEDFTVAFNSMGYYTMTDIVSGMKEKPPSIYVGKRLNDAESWRTGYMKLFLKDRYIMLADFKNPARGYSKLRYVSGNTWNQRHYRSDIYYLKKEFETAFAPVGKLRILADRDFAEPTPNTFLYSIPTPPGAGRACAVRVSFPENSGVKRALIEWRYSSINYDARFMGRDLYSFVKCGETATLRTVGSIKASGAEVTVYSLKP